MSGLIEVKIPDGKVIFLESDDIESLELTSAKDVRERAESMYQDALNTIDAVAFSLSKKMQDLAKQIEFNEYSVEFGVKLSAEVGAVVARAAGESTIKVSLKWSKPKS